MLIITNLTRVLRYKAPHQTPVPPSHNLRAPRFLSENTMTNIVQLIYLISLLLAIRTARAQIIEEGQVGFRVQSHPDIELLFFEIMMLLRQLSYAKKTKLKQPFGAYLWHKGGFHAGKGSIIVAT